MPDLKLIDRAKSAWLLGTGLFALLWAYWPVVVDMAERWSQSAEYSHGYLVPLLALGLLWFRYERLEMGEPRAPRAGWLVLAAGIVALLAMPDVIFAGWGFLPAGVALLGAGLLLFPQGYDPEKLRPTWWGLPLLIIGITLRLIATRYYIGWFDQLSLIPCVAGLVLLTVGWHGAKWTWPAVAFLVFMVPLPFSLETALRDPLRNVGTKASTYLMQTVGLPAIADGNRHEVLVGGMTHRIGVTEACSGLSMLMIFVALSTAVAVVIRRPIWERAVVFLSAVPIALIANVARITITGLMLYFLEGSDVYLGVGSWIWWEMPGAEFANSFFHDWAGWLMMPFALVLMWLELAIMKRLIIVEEEIPMSFGVKKTPAATTADAASKPAAVNGEEQNTKRPNKTPGGVHVSAGVGG